MPSPLQGACYKVSVWGSTVERWCKEWLLGAPSMHAPEYNRPCLSASGVLLAAKPLCEALCVAD